MDYLSQNKIKDYREVNKPKKCPILCVKNDKYVLDHDHQSGLCRGVISNSANLFLGKIENAWIRFNFGANISLPQSLRNVADYLEEPNKKILHPTGLRQLVTRFRIKSKEDQISLLLELGVDKDLISFCSNTQSRTKLYRDYLKQ